MWHLGVHWNCRRLGRAQGEEATRLSNVPSPVRVPSTWPAPPGHLSPPAEGPRSPLSLGLQRILPPGGQRQLPPALGRKVGECTEVWAWDQSTETLQNPQGSSPAFGHLLQPLGPLVHDRDVLLTIQFSSVQFRWPQAPLHGAQGTVPTGWGRTQ